MREAKQEILRQVMETSIAEAAKTGFAERGYQGAILLMQRIQGKAQTSVDEDVAQLLELFLHGALQPLSRLS
jgi:hypothetical protein